MKKILIIVIILVVMGGVLLFLSSQKTPPKELITNNLPITNQPTLTNQPISNQEIILPRELRPEEKLALLKNELKIKARNFAERYGSFSTDARFENLRDLKKEMTSRLWQEIENYISIKEKSLDEARDKELIEEFYGVTTRALNVEEISFSEDKAEYLISCQREEIKGTQVPRVFYQDLELTMVREKEEWKIDYVAWSM